MQGRVISYLVDTHGKCTINIAKHRELLDVLPVEKGKARAYFLVRMGTQPGADDAPFTFLSVPTGSPVPNPQLLQYLTTVKGAQGDIQVFAQLPNARPTGI